MPKFSFILPTRERTSLVYQFLESLYSNTQKPDEIEILLYIDEDDTESPSIHFPLFCVKKVIGPRQSMSLITRRLYAESRGENIFLMNDDVICRTKNWDEKVLNVLSKHKDGIALLYTNDGYYGSKVSTFPILPRHTCELLDLIVPPIYKSHSIDSHVFDVFKKLDLLGHSRIHYLGDVLFEHMHFGLTLDLLSRREAVLAASLDQKLFLAEGSNRQKTALELAAAIQGSRNLASV